MTGCNQGVVSVTVAPHQCPTRPPAGCSRVGGDPGPVHVTGRRRL